MASQPKDNKLEDDTILTSEGLAEVARRVRLGAGDNQEEAAAKLDVGQSQISKAENGVESYSSVCIRMIEEYSNCTVEHPLYRITRKSE